MNSADEFGPKLIEASIDGDISVVRETIASYPAAVSEKDSDGLTALHWACLCEHSAVAEVLLAAGADAAAVTGAGATALHSACRSGAVDIARLLLGRAGPRDMVNAVSADGNTPLHEAARGNCADCIALLLQHGANIDALSSSGNTALHWASQWGGVEVVSTLIEKGADTEILNKVGKSALDVVISVDEAAKVAVTKAFEEGLKRRKKALREKMDREDEERRQEMLRQRRAAREEQQRAAAQADQAAAVPRPLESTVSGTVFALSSSNALPQVDSLSSESGTDPNTSEREKGRGIADGDCSGGQGDGETKCVGEISDVNSKTCNLV